jgi:hypothetical protein
MPQVSSDLRFEWQVDLNEEGRMELRCTSSRRPASGLKYQVVYVTSTPVDQVDLFTSVHGVRREHVAAWSKEVSVV